MWASRIIRCARAKAKSRGYVSMRITPEEVVSLMLSTKHCVACGGELNWITKGESPHLHHNHTTGVVIGYVHSRCNHVEGIIRRQISEGPRPIKTFLEVMFPEAFSETA
jgi:hypothetical protein